MALEGLIEILTAQKSTRQRKIAQINRLAGKILAFRFAAENSGYDLNRFLSILDQD
jgi:hypothetical protein